MQVCPGLIYYMSINTSSSLKALGFLAVCLKVNDADVTVCVLFIVFLKKSTALVGGALVFLVGVVP